MKTKCCVFRLLTDESDKQTSLNVLPQRNGFQINPAKFFICEMPKHSPGVKLPGGYSRPALPWSVFNRPTSCLPTPKTAAKKLKQEDVQLKYFMEKDTIRSINEFDPEKRTAENITTGLHLDRNMRLCTFSSHKIYCRQNRPLYCIVHNVGKLRSPLMLSAYNEGTQVPKRMYLIIIMS